MSRRVALLAGTLLLAGLAGAAAGIAWERLAGPEHALRAAQIDTPGPIDIGFAQFMSMHHEQAVVMAQILLSHGDTPLAALAHGIVQEQLLEIGQMKGWLQVWRKPFLPATSDMDWMLLGRYAPDETVRQYVIDCRSAPGGMPGLATSDQLNQLRHLDGLARDRLFIQLMTAHHRSALVMARFAAINANTSEVRNLAAQMLIQQGEELSVMAMMSRPNALQALSSNQAR